MSKKFKSNYSADEYEEEIYNIKKKYKKKTTKRDIMLRRIKTSNKYDNDYKTLKETIPKGLKLLQIRDIDLLSTAKKQILDITHYYNTFSNQTFNKNATTNYQFYIGTSYFDKKDDDSYPLFKLDDIRISAISQLVLENEVLKERQYDKKLLNIVVRVYKEGDILNFHTDRDIFGENIYGIVVYNKEPLRGLLLTNNKTQYMLNEEEGLTWHLSNEARWIYENGYASKWINEDIFSSNEIVRISISFRFFENERQIPIKKYEIVYE